jgi:3-dehydroquinate dehydratase/shikimate dehydrogenase
MAKPLLCVTVTADTTAELRRRRDAVEDADLIELRLDTVRDPTAAGALAGRSRPVIVTCRPAWEGGQFAGAEDERLAILGDAFALGAEFVDVEWRAAHAPLVERERGRRIVLSAHHYGGLPRDLEAQVRAMRATGAEVVKVAVQTHRLSDCLPLLELGAASGRTSGLVLIGMGERGLATRVLAGRFGSRWTYAGSLESVGQATAAELLTRYAFRSIDDGTDLYGIVGSPVSHSVSPAMHNAAFRAAHVDAVYLPMPAADADDFVRFAQGLGVRGASVTIPFKVALFDRADEVHPVGRRIGAINTLRMTDGRWMAGNTDASGFVAPLRDRVPLDGVRASILGAGGSARAVAVALGSSGARVTVHARDRARAADVAMLVGGETGRWPPPRGTWDLLVNCTPIGMYPDVEASPIPIEALGGGTVYDLVYNPPVTKLLSDAAAAGCGTINGLEMLVAQAAEQFEWWTGRRAPAGIMREAALARLAEFTRDEDHVV